MSDIVWLVVTRTSYGLNATAHATKRDAIKYLAHLYAAPSHVVTTSGNELLAWIDANTDDEVLLDYDEV